ncbi:MAG TPA: hypothetical protein V6D17_18420, partial [Candidatus Obscuribacterales bacterium]
ESRGKRSRAYIDALVNLGMHYNRTERFRDASRVLQQALSLADSGVLKPTPPQNRVPERVVEIKGNQNDGVVGAQVIRQSLPYEEVMEGLLPQLITAEIGANQLMAAETHVKRLIKLAGTNPVTSKLNLMSAYTSYAQILRKLHRHKEADAYQRKADDINRSFIPM